jgi:proteasome accessory factor B
VLGILLSAIDSGQAVQFPHRPARSEPYTTRTVEPWGVVTDRGRWYLVGHDRDRDGDELTVEYGMSDPLAREIASYGPDAVALEPQSLRDDVLARLRAQASKVTA